MRRLVALALAALGAVADADEPTVSTTKSAESPGTLTGAGRTGLYVDGDQTTVFRALATMGGGIGRWRLDGTASVDVVSSSSVDVRSSPALSKVDVVSSASGTSTNVGKMTDRRIAGTLSSGWNDSRGHTVNLSATYANERDYNSVNGGLNASFDLFERTTTLLAGANYTYNWIGSVLDPTFARQAFDVAWTAGIAQVLTQTDALRLRYDGTLADGYQGSPYRNVRFGNWTPSIDQYGRINFGGTIGSADGLPETVPNLRVRHALALEWVHSFVQGLALYTMGRVGTDDWGIQSATGAAELRAASENWRFRVGYRFYIQSDADFYRSKYLLAANNYTYYTSDKELSREIGHIANIGLSRVLKKPHQQGDTRVLLDATVTMLYYTYPDFVLLPSRLSGFVELGLTWER